MMFHFFEETAPTATRTNGTGAQRAGGRAGRCGRGREARHGGQREPPEEEAGPADQLSGRQDALPGQLVLHVPEVGREAVIDTFTASN